MLTMMIRCKLWDTCLNSYSYIWLPTNLSADCAARQSCASLKFAKDAILHHVQRPLWCEAVLTRCRHQLHWNESWLRSTQQPHPCRSGPQSSSSRKQPSTQPTARCHLQSTTALLSMRAWSGCIQICRLLCWHQLLRLLTPKKVPCLLAS